MARERMTEIVAEMVANVMSVSVEAGDRSRPATPWSCWSR